MTTTAALIAEAKRLDAEATKGGWLASEYLDDGRIGILTDSNGIVVALRSGVATKQDAAFIARARTLLTQLADALERIQISYAACAHALRDMGEERKVIEARLEAAEARLAKVLGLLGEARPHIGDEYSRSWPDDPEFDAMLARIDGELAYSDGPARPMEPADG